ncbi:transcriptional regulator [Ammoniphilus oxalaticus]|uniref:Transcriptional regulator n=1 Tax=Ammoniphilus oxalaticus TaxID=66863 RepID=A0A419SGC7_9BACL|nr:LysR family transcriptional regulator [Ammoniphilus oxalaticus]RKD22842.1 transcriptional regulator [Ammoniphilus oxalaticus]
MNQHLVVFVKVVDLKSFSQAAEQLHMTQPAVSQYIQSLERLMGVKLLDRTSKMVRLNKAGEIVYHHAVEILGLYSRMQSLVDDLSNTASGTLSIGASYTFGEHVLPHIIAKLSKQYPHIKPTITIGNTKEISDLVRNHQLDIGIVEGNFNQRQLSVENFAEDLMYIFTSAEHPFTQLEMITAAELKEETWIVREVGSGTREAAEKMFVSFGFIPVKVLEFGSAQLIKESVEAGLGITLLSQWATQKELSLGTLSIVNIQGMPIRRKFSIVTHSATFQTKAMEVFKKIAQTSIV